MSKNADKIGDRIPVNEKGNPFDIITGPLGFFAMGGNETIGRLWIASFTHSGK